MKYLVPGLALFLAIAHAPPTTAQDSVADALRQADTEAFRSADLNLDGKITRLEIIHFTDLVFLSADADGDEELTSEELLAWDIGYLHVAEMLGTGDAYNDAKLALLKELDLNGDDRIEHEEMSAAALYSFYQSDENGDRTLDQLEFTTEFVVLGTVRPEGG